MLNIAGYNSESIVDGEGLRSVIYFSGCKWNCLGCHNAEAQSFDCGQLFNEELQSRVINNIKSNPLISGLTISGGDPFFSAKEVLEFILKCKNEIENLNIWGYTGFTFENLIQHKENDRFKLLQELDVLIDGKFEQSLMDISLQWKGSSNQRTILVQESLRLDSIILHSSDQYS